MLRHATQALIASTVVALALTGCEKPDSTTPDEVTQDSDDPDSPEEEVEEVEEESPGGGPEAAVVLNKANFDEVVHANMEAVGECYSAALGESPELAGEMKADFSFDAEGQVVSVTVAEGSSLTDEGVANCIAEQARAWEFGKPPHGEMTLQFPFTLEPG